jgi:hypothetical protein
MQNADPVISASRRRHDDARRETRDERRRRRFHVVSYLVSHRWSMTRPPARSTHIQNSTHELERSATRRDIGFRISDFVLLVVIIDSPLLVCWTTFLQTYLDFIGSQYVPWIASLIAPLQIVFISHERHELGQRV